MSAVKNLDYFLLLSVSLLDFLLGLLASAITLLLVSNLFASCKDLIGKNTESGELINNSNDFASYLLEDALVAVVPGIAFGMEDYFRISYATSENDLIEAFKRIKESCAKLK